MPDLPEADLIRRWSITSCDLPAQFGQTEAVREIELAGSPFRAILKSTGLHMQSFMTRAPKNNAL